MKTNMFSPYFEYDQRTGIVKGKMELTSTYNPWGFEIKE